MLTYIELLYCIRTFMTCFIHKIGAQRCVSVKDQPANIFGFSSYTVLSLQFNRAVVDKWVWPCANKTSFTKLGSLDSASNGLKFAVYKKNGNILAINAHIQDLCRHTFHSLILKLDPRS